MRPFSRQSRISAYVCPRGVFAIEWRHAAAGIEVDRTFEVPSGLKTAAEAADHLVSVLESGGIERAAVTIALRGFGVAYHVLQFPPASDAVLGPIIEREMRRLEPHLGGAIVRWMPLPALEAEGSGAPPQRAVFAIAAPTETLDAFRTGLHAAGHRLAHATALPVAVQRLLEHFDSGTGTISTITALPDGAYIAFSLSGGLRILVEPPLPATEQHEAAALVEEAELASMFVRQQFRGVHTDRVVLVGARDSLTELKSLLGERLKVPVKHLELDRLAPAGFAALGAAIDARSAHPLGLDGAGGAGARARGRLEMASLLAMFVLALAGIWTIAETVRAMRAARELTTAERRVDQAAFGFVPARATAEQRRLVRDALAALQTVAADRAALQQSLVGLADALMPPARLDSLRLVRGGSGWRVALAGSVASTTNARAVQTLHDLYRELPRRLPVDSLRLDGLAYAESPDSDAGIVRFQLSFAIPDRNER